MSVLPFSHQKKREKNIFGNPANNNNQVLISYSDPIENDVLCQISRLQLGIDETCRTFSHFFYAIQIGFLPPRWWSSVWPGFLPYETKGVVHYKVMWNWIENPFSEEKKNSSIEEIGVGSKPRVNVRRPDRFIPSLFPQERKKKFNRTDPVAFSKPVLHILKTGWLLVRDKCFFFFLYLMVGKDALRSVGMRLSPVEPVIELATSVFCPSVRHPISPRVLAAVHFNNGRCFITAPQVSNLYLRIYIDSRRSI